MTKYEAGYLQVLRDVQVAVRTFLDETASLDGKLELLGVLSFVDSMIGTSAAGDGGETVDEPANENVELEDTL